MRNLLTEEQALRSEFSKFADNIKHSFISAAKFNNLTRVQEILATLKDPKVTIGLAAAHLSTEEIINHPDDQTGFPALHWSIINTNKAMTDTLLAVGIDANLRAKNGQRPLDIIVGKNSSGSTGQAESLVKAGAIVTHEMSKTAEKNGMPRATVSYLNDVYLGKAQQSPDIHSRAYNQMQTALDKLKVLAP